MRERLLRVCRWAAFTRRGRLFVLSALAPVVCVGSGCCVYNHIAARRLNREMSETPRDPVTGIVVGAEPVELGKGRRSVLLLHGYLGSPRDFGELPLALAEAGYRVVAPLHPGHGTKPTDFEKVTVDQLYESIRDAYQRLRRDSDAVAVVGFSMGGALAVRLIRDTEAPPPEAVVLASPYFGVTYRWYAVLSPETWTSLLAPFIPYLIKGKAFLQVNRREAVNDLYSYAVVPTASALLLQDLGRDVFNRPPALMPQGTLVVYSTGDMAAAPDLIRRMADQWSVPPERRLVLSRTNHHVFTDFDRKQVIERVVRFIGEHMPSEGKSP